MPEWLCSHGDKHAILTLDFASFVTQRKQFPRAQPISEGMFGMHKTAEWWLFGYFYSRHFDISKI